MTKTLTEQWRDGELFGFHYVKVPKEEPSIHNVSSMDYLLDEHGVEVLAPVPSYDDYCLLTKKAERLQEQIKEANECIKDKYLWTCSACSRLGSCMSCGNRYFGRYIKKWGVE